MRSIIIILIFSLLAGGISSCRHTDSRSGGTNASDSGRTGSVTSQKEIYTCPMHPWIVSDKPGACPICGMALVKRSAAAQATAGELTALGQISLSPTQRIISNVSTTPVVRKPISRDIAAVGVVDYAEPRQAKVAARFRGRIEKLYVDFTGDVVHRGDPLFELYSPDLVSAEQDVILAAKAISNADTAAGNSSYPMQLLQAARERLRINFGMTPGQIAGMEKSQAPKSTVTFYSPIQGTVIVKEIQEGQYVDEGTLLYQLADLSTVWVYLDVYEKDVRFLRLGQQARITSEAYPGQAFAGRVTFIDPVINSDTRTVRVRTEIPNAGGRLKPQMYVRAAIDGPGHTALVIPSSAVLATGKRDVVWIEVRPNTFEPRTVTLGIRTEESCEVLSGLKEGESVVSSGGFLVDSESQLQAPTGAAKGSEAPAKIPDTLKHTGSGHKHVVDIHVTEKYTPSVIRLKTGETVSLNLIRDTDTECTNEITVEGFGIHRVLPAMATTTIELRPVKRGSYRLICGMGMEQGKLIVE